MDFVLKIVDLYWIEQTIDNDEDLCLHGHVFVQIGNTIVDTGTKDDWTLSVGAYRMLHSIYRNHCAEDLYTGYFLTCCGHGMWVDKKTGALIISDCPYGLNWSVTHQGDNVHLTTEAGEQVTMALTTYREIVFAFADQIEAFYQSNSPKTFYDAESKNAFHQFWSEWQALRNGNTTEIFSKKQNSSIITKIISRIKPNKT